MTDTEDGIEAESQRIDDLSAAITDPATGLAGLASAIDNLTVIATDGDGSQQYQSEAIRALKSAVRALVAEGVEGAARDHTRVQAVRDYVADATQSLSTRVDLTDQQVSIVAQSILQLQAAIPGLATTSALQSLQSTLVSRGLEIDALSSALTSLQSTVAGKASSSALNSLTSRVSATESGISALSSDLTSLETEVGGKASSTAVSGLTSRVNTAEGEIDALSEALIDLGVMSPAGVARTILKMAAESGPSGVLARIGLRALVGDSSDNTRVAALFLEALSGGESRVVVEADRFTVASGSARQAVFEVVGGQVYLRSARIKQASIDTLMIGTGAVTVPVTTYIPDVITPPASGGSWANIAQCYILREGYPTHIDFRSALDCYSAGVMRMRVVRTVGSTVTNLQPGDWFQSLDWGQTQTGFAFTDFDLGTGATSYTVQAQRAHPDLTGGRNGVLRMFQRYLAVQQVKR